MAINKSIYKNTFFLYLRMLFTLVVSLYTSRVVLNALGVVDFGIYNLVGGIIVLFSFISSAMTGATQRFLNFEMAKNSEEAVRRVFSVSMNVHVIMAVVICLLAETVGLWFLNNKLNIPSERSYAANAVFQFSVLTFVVNIVSIPYHAAIIAYEKMSFYAWISIIEAFFKLMIVFVLALLIYDKLVLYAGLTFFVSLIIYLAYWIACRRMFKACRYQFVHDGKILKDLLGFSGWALFGNMALIASNQGVAMVMNIFLGVTVNAAMGIANQVNAAVYGFVSNFQMAFSPQITKSYASADTGRHLSLVFQASRLSYYLLLILAIPLLFDTDYILALWLKRYPEHTVSFTQLIILFSLTDALAGPFWMSIYAVGKVKNYQLGVSLVLLLNLPLSYIVLYTDSSPVYVFIIKIAVNLLALVFRTLYVKHHIKFSFKRLFVDLYMNVVLVSICAFGFTYLLRLFLFPKIDGIVNMLFFSLCSVFITLASISVVGLQDTERKLMYGFVGKYFGR